MRYQNQSTKRGPLVRTLIVVATVAMLVTGVTFAALTSQNALLQGSSVTSATASLLVGDGQGGFLSSAHGFAFNGIEPGGAPWPITPNIISLKNSGTSDLALRVMMNPNTLANPQNAKLDRMFVVITPPSGPLQEIPFTSLLAAYTSGTPIALNSTLGGNQIGQYQFQIQMAADAVNSTLTGVNLTGIDLIFSGTSVIS